MPRLPHCPMVMMTKICERRVILFWFIDSVFMFIISFQTNRIRRRVLFLAEYK